MHRLILYVKVSLQSALHASSWFKSKKHEIEVSLAWLCANISMGRCKSARPPSNESGAEGRVGSWGGVKGMYIQGVMQTEAAAAV